MILGPKVGVLPSFVAKIIGNNYCTETSVQPATVEVLEYSIRVFRKYSCLFMLFHWSIARIYFTQSPLDLYI